MRKMFIGGRWMESGQSAAVLNPADESTIAEVAVADAVTVQLALERARDAQRSWGRLPAIDRGYILRRWADLVDQHAVRLARTITQEQGKPITEARGVVPIIAFDQFDDGMRFANDSRFGLAAYLFTNDMNRVMRAVRDLECGELYINRGPGESIHGYHTGWKLSGIGGDDGKHGLDHYLQRKTVYLRYQ